MVLDYNVDEVVVDGLGYVGEVKVSSGFEFIVVVICKS